MDLTFCIPFYGKEPNHTRILEVCIQQIRKFYTNRILICKTSDSYMPDLSTYENISIFNTFIDGSHVLGAIELLTRECTTQNFLICHDSMFFLKPLPDHILSLPYYSLWHFNTYRENHPIPDYINYHSTLTVEQKDDALTLYETAYGIKWNGLFGPAFGGKLTMLHEFWTKLGITPEKITPYLGRQGLMMCERYFPLVLASLGYDTTSSLNGLIFHHPHAFSVSSPPDFNTVTYPGYLFKVWLRR